MVITEESEAAAAALETAHRPEDYDEHDCDDYEQRKEVQEGIPRAAIDVRVVHGLLDGRQKSHADENGDEDSDESHNPHIHRHGSCRVQGLLLLRTDSPPAQGKAPVILKGLPFPAGA